MAAGEEVGTSGSGLWDELAPGTAVGGDRSLVLPGGKVRISRVPVEP